MKVFRRLSFLLLFLPAACGHSGGFLDASTFNEGKPLPSASPVTAAFSNSAAPSENDLDEARSARADEMGKNPPPPLPPYEPEGELAESEPDDPLDAYIQQVVEFLEGEGSGFGQADLIFWLLGPPYGGGEFAGSTDVVSLGIGGEIVLGFPRFFPIDGEGPDFIIFENPFRPRGGRNIFAEPAVVSVSQDGIAYHNFPCLQNRPFTGCAGTHLVFANAETNPINPRDPSVAGGDAYDLADVGLPYARFIRIRDISFGISGAGSIAAGTAGFDLDAVSVVHGAKP